MIEYNAQNALQWSRLGARRAFGAVMGALADADPALMVLAADVAGSAGLTEFSQTHPAQFMNAGIAEINMVGMAAGLAKEGYKVVVTSFAPFASMRCFEAVRTYLGYMHLNVTVVGIASGLSMGVGGNTHFGLEDLALMRTIPGMTVLSPADCTESVKATEAALALPGPKYLRLTGQPGNPVVYKEDYEFRAGRAVALIEGSDAAILATGTPVYESLRAARLLKKQGVNCAVWDVHTVKPLDGELLAALGEANTPIITAEEHSIVGGLGSAVAEALADGGYKNDLLRLALPDAFGPAANYGTLMRQYGLTAPDIAAKIQSFMEKRR